MNVAILHCHLERGGVTQVIENHVAALTDRVDRIALVSGPRRSGLSQQTIRDVESIVVESLEYDAVRRNTQDPSDLSRFIVDALRAGGFTPDNTLLHWHNHSLGKNVAQPPAIEHLANAGFRQLLQIHDFAEDFRPENLCALIVASEATTPAQLAEYCYPAAPNLHYATLSSHDARIIESLGFKPQCVHRLPNSVTLGEDVPDESEARDKLQAAAGLLPDFRWCLYPVRGIRRKNLGEFCLLSQMLPDNVYAGVTLPPATDIERRSYERWKHVATRTAPKAIFDAGTFEGVSFRENLAACHCVLSTSAAEGFGMAFLEPWLARRAVVARRLPAVVSDFESAGLKLDDFYDEVPIPAPSKWRETELERTAIAFRQAWDSVPPWARPTSPMAPEDSDAVDFGKLTTSGQIEVLTRMGVDDGFATEVRARNVELVRSLERPADAPIIEHNRHLIEQEFSIGSAARRLLEIYTKVLASSPIEGHRRHAVSSIDLVCAGREFYPCRTDAVLPNE
ncbi:MAG: hypothetical protein AAFU85_20055 [Planctomycetota bacterium]